MASEVNRVVSAMDFRLPLNLALLKQNGKATHNHIEFWTVLEQRPELLYEERGEMMMKLFISWFLEDYRMKEQPPSSKKVKVSEIEFIGVMDRLSVFLQRTCHCSDFHRFQYEEWQLLDMFDMFGKRVCSSDPLP